MNSLAVQQQQQHAEMKGMVGALSQTVQSGFQKMEEAFSMVILFLRICSLPVNIGSHWKHALRVNQVSWDPMESLGSNCIRPNMLVFLYA